MEQGIPNNQKVPCHNCYSANHFPSEEERVRKFIQKRREREFEQADLQKVINERRSREAKEREVKERERQEKGEIRIQDREKKEREEKELQKGNKNPMKGPSSGRDNPVHVGPIHKNTGSNGESLQDWLQLVNRKALALDSLRGTFEVQLTESQWQKLVVEERKQLPNETGSAYVLDEAKQCRRRAIPITNAELAPYLIRGVFRSEIRSVMMGDPPATVNAFLAELRRLEAIGISPIDSSKAMFDTAPPPSSTNNTRSLSQILEGLTGQVALLTSYTNRPPSPGPVKKQVTFERRPPETRNEIQCYNCVNWMGISNVGVRPSIQDHCQMEAVIFPEISTNKTSNNIDENLTKEDVDAGNGVIAAITHSPTLPLIRVQRTRWNNASSPLRQ
ncbi:Uncharacterized protein APZ42_014467 [Daphnia magna]|uniref:Uncharacterized protein n=1 Tax=Daphnia magna TaxID=35525 RepID=A0A162PVE4_9CRUS|nr:Uncharacterized protein APZ42_014467 [Daphnia magna]